MGGTSFVTVYQSFLNKITDFDIASMTDEEIENKLFPLLVSSITKFSQCKNDTTLDEDAGEFEGSLTIEEIEILSSLMVVEWYSPQINNVLNTKQFLSDKDYRFYSQANHLKSNMDAKKEALREVNRMISDYSFRNVEM